MKVVRTTKCNRHGHPEFRITYDPSLVVVAEDVEWLIRWLEESVAEGSRYAPGETCQVGWTITMIRQAESGDLSIWEPDMRQIPFEWVDSVSNTLVHLRVQKDVVESVLGADNLSFPSMCHSGIICSRLGKGEDIVLECVASNHDADSGWFFGCRGEDHDHNHSDELLRVSLYEAAIHHAPQIIPYLALPAGTLVVHGSGAPEIFWEGVPLSFGAGSYLARLYATS